MALLRPGLAAALIALAPSTVWSDGVIRGQVELPVVAGNDSLGGVGLYEVNLFVANADGSVGLHRRLGAPPGEAPSHDGAFSADVPPGNYSLYATHPLFFTRPALAFDIAVEDGEELQIDLPVPVHYSTYALHGASWTDPSDTWYQTFVAVGERVPSVSTVLTGADEADGVLRIAVVRDEGGSISEWPVVAEREVPFSIDSGGDLWARFARDDVELEPGERYAVRLQADAPFQVYKRDKDGDSYAQGQAHRGSGEPQPFDLNITVFSEPEGACITHQRREPGFGEGLGETGYHAFGQSFVATGTGLAAFDVWAGGLGASSWDVPFEFSIRTGGPDGPAIGPTKRVQAGFQAGNVGLHGVSFSPGEVELLPGESYYLHIEADEEVVPFVETSDAIAAGSAHAGGAAIDRDLSATIVEYGCDPEPENPDGEAPPDGARSGGAAPGEAGDRAEGDGRSAGLVGGCSAGGRPGASLWLVAIAVALRWRCRFTRDR